MGFHLWWRCWSDACAARTKVFSVQDSSQPFRSRSASDMLGLPPIGQFLLRDRAAEKETRINHNLTTVTGESRGTVEVRVGANEVTGGAIIRHNINPFQKRSLSSYLLVGICAIFNQSHAFP